eukprot:5987770-Alexandrium_andersonii.AAC.1
MLQTSASGVQAFVVGPLGLPTTRKCWRSQVVGQAGLRCLEVVQRHPLLSRGSAKRYSDSANVVDDTCVSD